LALFISKTKIDYEKQISGDSLLVDSAVLRAIEDAVDALVRLDERVAAGPPGLAALLKLRSAQAIVAANDRPPDAIGDDTGRAAAVPDGDAAFAALLGWWFAPGSREFITDDPHLRRAALALDHAVGAVRNERALTAGLLDEAAESAGLQGGALPDLLDATLSVAEHEAWPALLLSADLSSGACGRERSVMASLARAVAVTVSGLTADVLVLPPRGEDLAGALYATAGEARAMQRRAMAYRDACEAAVRRCDEFGRAAPAAASLVRLMGSRPAMTVANAAESLALSTPTAGAAMERLADAEVVREITGRGRDRVFVYTPAVTLAG
jgi:hypothetical protein